MPVTYWARRLLWLYTHPHNHFFKRCVFVYPSVSSSNIAIRKSVVICWTTEAKNNSRSGLMTAGIKNTWRCIWRFIPVLMYLTKNRKRKIIKIILNWNCNYIACAGRRRRSWYNKRWYTRPIFYLWGGQINIVTRYGCPALLRRILYLRAYF